MQSTHIKGYLRELCHDIDEGRSFHRFDWRRAAATLSIPVVLGLAGASGCAEELCGDGADNDRDGLLDCSDPDCTDFCGLNLEYAAPFPDDLRPLPPPLPNDLEPPVNTKPTVPPPNPSSPPKPYVGADSDDTVPVPCYGVPTWADGPNNEGAPSNIATRYGVPFTRR